MTDLVLPAFEMDCRDWFVLTASDAGMSEEVDGAPVLAVLSTVVVEDDLCEASGALSVGLIDDDEELETREVAPGAPVHQLLDIDSAPGTQRFVMPAPNGQPLALLAEFVMAPDRGAELPRRVKRLMCSFRWQ
jgi:hypothetical protein